MSALDGIVVLGGGHNGLVAATLLARAGERVLLVERDERLGGTLGTEEIHPGFRAPLAFAGLERFHPAIAGELGLERHGLRWLPQRGGTLVLLPGRDALALDPAGDLEGALARHSPRDAAALRAFEVERRRLTAALEPLLSAPLPRAGARLRERLSDLLVAGRTWRGLAAAGIETALRLLPMNVRDVLDERFESEPLKAAIAGPALSSAWMGPRSAGSLWNLWWQRPAWVSHLLAPPRLPAGGPAGLVDALARAAREAGVEIRTGTAVERILAGPDGVRGVVLEGGVELEARRVLSALDPRRTLLELLEPAALDAETALEVGALRARGNVAIVRLALDRLPRLAGGGAGDGALAGRIQIGATLDELERAYDASKYAQVAPRPQIEMMVPSIGDPSLAPAGGAVLHAWVQAVPGPGAARSGSVEDLRAEIARRVFDSLEEHDPGLTSSVLHADVATPADLERRFGITGGCLDHLEPALDQQLWLRPLLGWHLHATPIDGLFLGGAGAHPGGGPTGLPGRNAAQRVLARGNRPARETGKTLG